MPFVCQVRVSCGVGGGGGVEGGQGDLDQAG